MVTANVYQAVARDWPVSRSLKPLTAMQLLIVADIDGISAGDFTACAYSEVNCGQLVLPWTRCCVQYEQA